MDPVVVGRYPENLLPLDSLYCVSYNGSSGSRFSGYRPTHYMAFQEEVLSGPVTYQGTKHNALDFNNGHFRTAVSC